MASKWISFSKEERAEMLALPISPKLRKKLETADKPKAVRYGKAKGMGFQVDIAEWISKLTGVPYTKGDDESLIATRIAGCNGTDIILRGKAKQLFPFSVECKNQENMNLIDTVEQASGNVLPGTEWVVFHRRKALKDDIVILSKVAFGELMSRIIAYHNPQVLDKP